MGPQKSAEEMELDREEAELRGEAENLSPVRPEDATIHDDANPADARAAAREGHDSGNGERPDGAKQSAATDADKSDASKADDKAKTQKPDDKAKDSQDKTSDKGATDDAKLTPFQKERRRLDETWKKVEARKTELEQREQELAKRERALAEQKQQPQKQAATERPKIDGGNADDWDAIAADFEAEGNTKLRDRAKENAARLREQEKATTTSEKAAGPRERFTAEEVATMQKEWQANLEKAGKENPELNQEGTPLRLRVAELIKTRPTLSWSSDGILHAVEIAKTELKARQADELSRKNAELEAEVKRLTGLTALPSGGASPGGNAKPFDQLSLDEQEAALREESAA